MTKKKDTVADETGNQIGITMMPVDQLYFDPENPRLPSGVEGGDEEAVLSWLLDDGEGQLPELMGSIAQSGFFTGEPLLVAPKGAKSGHGYIVVEGNRRLAAVKLLRSPEKAVKYHKTVTEFADLAKQRSDLHQLPVVIYPNRDAVLQYLGFRHVTGVKQWAALAKAKYLQQLFELESRSEKKSDSSLKIIGRAIGSRANTVARLLAALKVYEKIVHKGYYGIDGLEESEVNFSLLTTALSYSNISDFVGMDGPGDMKQAGIKDANLAKLTRWIFERKEGVTRIGESRRLKDLNAVVASPKAMRQFDEMNRPLSEAVQYTGLPLENFRTAVGAATRQAIIAYDMLAAVDAGVEEVDQESTIELRNRTRDLANSVKQRIADFNEDGD